MSDKKKLGETSLEIDRLDTLSLSIIPLTSSTLKNAKLVKNSRMETSVELYNDPIAGSLQIDPADIADQIAASESDRVIITQLANLQSYDVYSLRTGLKKLGIVVEDDKSLDLSPEMKESLAEMSVQFTRPLIERIFGNDGIDLNDASALKNIFRDPDVSRVRDNLKKMTEATGIPLNELPKFIEEYNDVFLSVAYYRSSFENIGREADRFLTWVQELQIHRDVTSSSQTAAACKKVENSIRFLMTSIRERLVRFQSGFEVFWNDINKDSFQKLTGEIEQNHSSMGAILCGLSVKIGGWVEVFPDNEIGGPQKRAKYVITELEPGIEMLKGEEVRARSILGMTVLKV